MKKNLQQTQTLFVVNQFYPPDYAPTGQLIQELVSTLVSENILIRVFTGQPSYAFKHQSAPCLEKTKGIVVQRTRTTQLWKNRIRGKTISGLLFFIRAGFHLLKNLKKQDLVVLTTAPPFLTFLGYLLHKIIGVSYTCLIYDLYPDVAESLKVISPKHWIVKFWNKLNLITWNRAKQIIVLSRNMEERILVKYPHLAHKITIIPNWADPNRITPIKKSENWFAYKHHLTKKFTILYSGNMGRCHDMDTILQAAWELKEDPFQFVFIGGGAKYQSLINTAKKWGLNNCLFLPYQEREDLPYSLTACDLSLVSVAEGMSGIVAPSKLYSALASGHPIAVICDAQSYLREIIEQAKCGMTFANGDSIGLAEFIRQLASNSQLAESMGKAGRSYLISHFSLKKIAEKYRKTLGLTIPYEELKTGGLIKAKSGKV
ncbi:glycosyltransferase family 4 protein [Gloeothece verrucosa]|uniref:Glycosyl transferase group 1 n=1 Tax=Gloeothece verrucosa (strain PCC 7822) TaxID=497965 RepID=E0UKU8_GLOV7|nr:glycosyltransferase family 4 protein [Gloeothece verrucosa]ADN17578.1 glycosyl transferase group 1 [Gloeothece verrucosa PCC 7822]